MTTTTKEKTALRSTAKRVSAFLAIVFLAGSTTTVSANAATTADPDIGACPRGFFCAWSDDNAEGRMAKWEGDDSWWGDDGMHDDAETIYNNGHPGTYDDVVLYFDVNYRTMAFCLPQGDWRDWDMADNDYDSHKWRSGC
ncbi:peptidase inhibitor family I36 protein [Kribbella sp. CA-294648]|uniref:peptidase inhibitor family I36 protein n=1 Tax=Kribbella sp. CA-294648 TaxID=3239948 RepID=UPI003D8B710F